MDKEARRILMILTCLIITLALTLALTVITYYEIRDLKARIVVLEQAR